MARWVRRCPGGGPSDVGRAAGGGRRQALDMDGDGKIDKNDFKIILKKFVVRNPPRSLPPLL